MIVSIFVIVGLLTESRRSDSCKDETRAPRDRLGESFLAARLGHKKHEWNRFNCVLMILLLRLVNFRDRKC